MHQTFIFPGSLGTKKNRYGVGVNKKTGRALMFKNKVDRDIEKMVAEELLVHMARRIEGRMEMTLTVVYDQKNEPDIDGVLTTLMDAMQKAGLFDNDKNIARVSELEKRVSTSKEDPPRCIVTIGPLI